MLAAVLARTGWGGSSTSGISGIPGVPISDEAVVRFAFLDPEGTVASVRLRHGLAGHRNPPSFEAMGDGLFTLEFQAGDAARVEYLLELTSTNGQTAVVSDPLNPLTTVEPFGTKSVVVRAGCADALCAGDPLPEHVNELVFVPIELDGPGTVTGKREIAVWSPPGVDTGTELPVVLFLDGGDYVRFGRAKQILENLVGWGKLAPCRAVFVPPVQRDEEYSANPAMPEWLAQLFDVLKDALPVPPREQRFACGVSLGALCLLHAVSVNSDLFAGLVLQSGSYFQPTTDMVESKYPWFGRITQAVSHMLAHGLGPGNAPRIAATCGTVGENIRNNRHMFDTLARAGCDVSLTTLGDAHNWTCWRNSVGDALVRLLPGDAS